MRKTKTPLARETASSPARHYDSAALVDAPEHYEYARAFGTLTWSTWDHDLRPIQQRIVDFLWTFPPEDPVRHTPGGSLERLPDGSFAPGTVNSRVERFRTRDSRPGSMHELLARYGLKMVGATEFQRRPFVPGAFKETAQRRNIKLRVLHGGVDIEASNMDTAKAAYLDHQESKAAARDVREALQKMRNDLKNESK